MGPDQLGKMPVTVPIRRDSHAEPPRNAYLGVLAGSTNKLSPAPKVCKIMDFMASIVGLWLLFYIIVGFRSSESRGSDCILGNRLPRTVTPLDP